MAPIRIQGEHVLGHLSDTWANTFTRCLCLSYHASLVGPRGYRRSDKRRCGVQFSPLHGASCLPHVPEASAQPSPVFIYILKKKPRKCWAFPSRTLHKWLSCRSRTQEASISSP